MPQNKYTVQYQDGEWVVNTLGTPRIDTYNKKSEAVSYAKSRAKRFGDSMVEIFRKDGTLQDTITYQDSSKSKTSSSGGIFDNVL